MSQKNAKGSAVGGSGPVDDGGDNLPEKVPDQLVRGVDGEWRAPPAGQRAPEVKTRDQAITEITGDLRAGVVNTDQFDPLLRGVVGVEGLLRLRLAVRRAIPSQGHPSNFDSILMPGVEALQKAEPILRQEVSLALEDISMDQVQQDQRRVQELSKIQEPLQQLLSDIDAERTYCEQRLAGTLRLVHGRTQNLKQPASSLFKALIPVAWYATAPAQQGQHTKAATTKARTETEQATLAQVNQAQGGAGAAGTPQQGGTPPGAGGGQPPAGGTGVVGLPVKQQPQYAPPGRTKRKHQPG